MNSSQVLSIERPDSKLMTYYAVRCLLVPPMLLFLPLFYLRYKSMRYRFDDEGVSMSWGVLFRRQINLTYARIQDIHLTSGVVQRWFGLADIHIQTASGSAGAEMKIEGLPQYDLVRDFLYSRMRGYRAGTSPGAPPALPTATAGQTHGSGDAELAAVLREIHSEIRQVREALQQRPGAEDGTQT